MNSRTAYRLSGVILGVALIVPALAANAEGTSAGEARQQQARYSELRQQALATNPIQGSSLEELRRQSQRQNAAIHREMRRQSLAAKDAAVRKEAARLITERAAEN